MERVGGTDGDDHNFEFVGQKLQQIECPTLVSVAAGQKVMYLVVTHIFTLVIIRAVLPHGLISILASMFICAIVGYGVYRIVERPMLERLRIKRSARVAVAA